MEVGGMVSFSTGSMESLLGKLQSLMEGTDMKPKGLGTEIKGLKEELASINAGNLQTFARMREPSVPAKQWMRQVRETVFDIEDWADDYLHRTDREADKHVGIVKALKQRLKNLGANKNDPPNDQIQEFKLLIKEANDRFKRYELLQRTSSNSVDQTALPLVEDAGDPRQRALHAEETGLVGIHGPTEDLLAGLLPCGDNSADTGEAAGLKVVFLVGSGGLGKTTLVKQVLRQPRMQLEFEPRAFVHAGRNPSVKTVLMGILNQVLNGSRSKDYESFKEQQLIDELKTLLEGKRYFIVIDDVWSSTIWQVIKCALPEENKGSRVIITARKEDIATSSFMDSSCVYQMKCLSTDDQKYLFHGRIFGPGKECPPELVGMTDDILNKCCNVPLAIIAAAGLFASKGKAEPQCWKPVLETIKTSIHDQEEVEGVTRKMLYLSYTDLPNYIKSCFLYLSVFPEGYAMTKDRVIRRWIAEGFIGRGNKESSQKIGESCFDELISRGLIQPLPIEDNGQRCYVLHDLARELIVSQSAEENFVTLSSQLIDALPHDRIRRLSLQNHHHEVTLTMLGSGILSNARSLTIFGRHEGNHDLWKFRFLRVLDLEDTEGLEKAQLESINKKLFQLKYLGLGGDRIAILPEQIEELENLETLDIRRTGVRLVDVKKDDGFKKLMHLLVTDAKLPTSVKKMKQLQELSMVEVGDNTTPQSLQELGELEKLRILGIKWSRNYGDTKGKTEDPWEKNLVAALDKLGDHNLQSLCIDAGENSSLDFLVKLWSPSLNLEKFKLACPHYYFCHLPTKMANAKLPNLTYLEIGIDTVQDGDLKILRSLPALILLKLRVKASSGLVIGNQGFTSLEEFWYESGDVTLTGLEFDKGAMPKLWKLRLRCHARSVVHASPKLGLINLVSLKLVHVKMDCEGADGPAVKNAEAAITRATQASSTCRLEITV